ncbi:MAG: hypothetical protein PHX21_11905 [bacterium]|nr:hypothetical protein [bacterium]
MSTDNRKTKACHESTKARKYTKRKKEILATPACRQAGNDTEQHRKKRITERVFVFVTDKYGTIQKNRTEKFSPPEADQI